MGVLSGDGIEERMLDLASTKLGEGKGVALFQCAGGDQDCLQACGDCDYCHDRRVEGVADVMDRRCLAGRCDGWRIPIVGQATSPPAVQRASSTSDRTEIMQQFRRGF